MKDTVGIVVTYNTPKLIRDAITSIRKFYDIPIVIVDGSQYESPCYVEVRRLAIRFDNIRVINTKGNIGHGPGLHLGIQNTKEKNIIVFDSDIIMKKPCLEVMAFKMLHPRVYGIGQVVRVDQQGHNNVNGIQYLHPHFAMINRVHYNSFLPFTHHGAPFIKAAISLNSQSNIHVVDFKISKYILHLERGTRNVITAQKALAKPQKVSSYPKKHIRPRLSF